MAEAINNFFAEKYFCNTQTGLSTTNDTAFQIHKKIPTSSIEPNCNQKKKTRVK
jgi:hypothetical protein